MDAKLRPIREKTPEIDLVVDENPVINRILLNRGVRDVSDIEYQLSNLIPPSEMKGVSEGADLLIKHILNESRILIVGDYDCDGATSTTIAVEGLSMLGAKNVDFAVPDRLTQGYGLSPDVVKGISHKEPDLIITVDNGISSIDGVREAKEAGYDVLVTDHHLPAESGDLPDADVLINPNQPGCDFPSKNIAGCGVAFYLIAGLRMKMRDEGVFDLLGIQEPNIAKLIDVLALGTVADVVGLDKNNRTIVYAGLEYIRMGMARPMIYQILSVAGADYRQIDASDFGFKIGPRVNAAGRLDSMDLAIRGFLTTNELESWGIAKRLDKINQIRKEMSSDHEEEAQEILDSDEVSSDADGVCLYNPNWHEGVVGILAGRVKEKMNRPVICLTQTHDTALVVDAQRQVRFGNYPKAEELLEERRDRLEKSLRKKISVLEGVDEKSVTLDQISNGDPSYNALAGLIEMVKQSETPEVVVSSFDQFLHNYGEIKGSCRSVEGIHLKHALDHINKRAPDILSKFGGHAMAAGVTVKLSKFEDFRKEFDREISKEMTEEIKEGRIDVDMSNIPAEHMTMSMAEKIGEYGPWGQHFPEPLFKGDFEVMNFRVLKDKHLKLSLRVPGTKKVVQAISFNSVEKGEVPVRQGHTAEVVYKLSVNEFRGERNLQLMVEHLQDPQLVHEIQERARFEDDDQDQEVLSGVVQDQKKGNGKLLKSHSESPSPAV